MQVFAEVIYVQKLVEQFTHAGPDLYFSHLPVGFSFFECSGTNDVRIILMMYDMC